MSQFTRALGAALGVVILGSMITLIPQKAALGQNGNNQPVIVKNTPLPTTVTNTPLPVSGNVNASQSGAWSVGVNNFPTTQSVSFSGPQPVSLTNTTSAPLFTRDVDNPAHTPVFGSCFLSNVTSNQTCNLVFYNSSGSFSVVPAGNRLVIEFVSGELDLPTGTGTVPIHYGIRTTLGQPPQIAYTDLGFDPRLSTTAFGNDIWLINQQTRIYEDAGFNVVLGVSVSTNSPYTMAGTVTGYLVSQ